MMYKLGRRNQFRIVVIALISLVSLVFFQNCGGGINSQSSTDSSSSSGGTNTGSGTTPGTSPSPTPTPVAPAPVPPATPTAPVLLPVDNALLSTICNPFIDTSNKAYFTANPTVSGVLSSSLGDGGTGLGSLDSANNSVTINFNINAAIVNNGAGSTNIVPPPQYVQTSLINCTFSSAVTVSVVTNNASYPATFTSAVNMNPGTANYGMDVAATVSASTIAQNILTLRNVNVEPLSTTSGSVRLDLNRASTAYRCVQGSFYIRMKVRTQVLNLNQTADYSANDINYKYVQVNIQNRCWGENKLASSVAPARIAGYGTVVAASTNWLAVLAPKDDGAVTGSGTVSVFRNNSGSWGFCQRIIPPNPSNSESLTSVAISDDGKLAIGHANLNSRAGGVYIYNHNGQACNTSPWGNAQTIPAPTADSTNLDQLFGYSLAINNGNLAVGAPSANAKRGSVYIYSCSATTCNSRYVIANNIGTQAAFGSSVSLSNSLLAVGAPQAILAEYLSDGFVKVFDISAAAVERVMLRPNDGSTTTPLAMRYGDSVSLLGNRLAVGAPLKPNGASVGAGGAYYYNDFAGATVKRINGPAVDNNFVGRAVALSASGLFVSGEGFVNREGRVAYYLNSRLTNATTNYTFGGGNNSDYFFFGFDKTASNDYGFSLAVTGNNIMVGAKIKPSPNNGGGAAYIYGIR